jgi:hypothetical protein
VTRSHRRLAVPAVAGALALATALLAACSAGQLAATSQTVTVIPGAQRAVPVGTPSTGTMPQTIGVSNATLDYPGPEGYKKGGTARLSLWIFNNTTGDITLTAVNSPAGQVRIATGTHSGAVSPCLSSGRPIQPNPSTGAPTAGVEPSAGASAGVSAPGPTGTPSTHSSAKPTGSATPSAAGSPSPSPSPSPAQVGSADIHVPVKAFGCAVLNSQAAQYLVIDGLANAVGSGMTVPVWFTFQVAGGNEISVGTENDPLNVPVDTPASPASRGPVQVPATQAG